MSSLTPKYSLESIDPGQIDWHEILTTNFEKLDEVIHGIEQGVAGLTLTAGALVRRDSAGLVQLAACTEPTHWPQGICRITTPAGATTNIQSLGGITNSTWAWTPGRLVFAGITLGTLTQADPEENVSLAGITYARTVVGLATAADRVFVHPYRTKHQVYAAGITLCKALLEAEPDGSSAWDTECKRVIVRESSGSYYISGAYSA